MTNQSSLKAIDSLADAVMRGVVKAYPKKDLADRAEEACAIMRAEVKAFLFDDSYKAERECVLLGSLSNQYVVASIVTRCVEKLAA